MKKVLFAGALAACMALSSAAFAAESFGTDGITGTYDKQAGTVSVTTIPASITTGADQLTLVILSGASTDNPTIVKESIMYIDQDSASNANKFTGMGLLNGLADGTYTLRMGSDNNAAIAEVEFTVTSGTVVEPISFTYGDVNGNNAPEVQDAMQIINWISATTVDESSVIGTSIEGTVDGVATKVTYGDVNGNNAPEVQDAMQIINWIAATTVDESSVIGKTISITPASK